MSESEVVTAPAKLKGNVAYSTLDESAPIAYVSEQPHCMFPARNVEHPDDTF